MSLFSAERLAPETAIVHVGRALDLNSALVFRALCQEQLDQLVSRFILDFSATRTLDATGLSALFAIHRQASLRGGGLVFAALQRPVADLLDATQARAFARFSTVEEAAAVLTSTFVPVGYTALFGTPARFAATGYHATGGIG